MPPEPMAGLLPQVYDELRRLAAARLAAEPDGHTLDATALVHEAFLRLRAAPGFESRGHFLRAAVLAMPRILVDHARRERAARRQQGGSRRPASRTQPSLRANGKNHSPGGG